MESNLTSNNPQSPSAAEPPKPAGIRDRSVENLLPLWVFTIVWNVASLASIPSFVASARAAHQIWPMLGLAFPVVGLILLALAIRRTLRIREFGDSVFYPRLDQFSPGGELVGAIHVQHPLPRDTPIEFRLKCISEVVTLGRKRGRSERVIWQDKRSLASVPESAEGAEIPVSMQIPADARITSGDRFGDRIVWWLEAKGAKLGANYFSRFEIPVGVVIQSESAGSASGSPTADDSEIAYTGSANQKFIERGISVEPMVGNGLRVHLAAGRTFRSAAPLLILGTLLAGFGVLFASLSWSSPAGIRIIFVSLASLPFSLGALLLGCGIFIVLASETVTVRRGSLVSEIRVLPYRRVKSYAADDIADIVCAIDGRLKSSTGSGSEKEIDTYGVKLKTRDGKTVWVANMIKQKDYAASLAHQIKGIFSGV